MKGEGWGGEDLATAVLTVTDMGFKTIPAEMGPAQSRPPEMDELQPGFA